MTTNTATSAFVAAHPDTVFGLLVDVDRLPEWNHIITRVLHRPAVVAPGAEWVVEMHAMGQTWPSRTRVEAIDRTDRRLVYRSGTDDANPSFTTWHWHVRARPPRLTGDRRLGSQPADLLASPPRRPPPPPRTRPRSPSVDPSARSRRPAPPRRRRALTAGPRSGLRQRGVSFPRHDTGRVEPIVETSIAGFGLDGRTADSGWFSGSIARVVGGRVGLAWLAMGLAVAGVAGRQGEGLRDGSAGRLTGRAAANPAQAETATPRSRGTADFEGDDAAQHDEGDAGEAQQAEGASTFGESAGDADGEAASGDRQAGEQHDVGELLVAADRL